MMPSSLHISKLLLEEAGEQEQEQKRERERGIKERWKRQSEKEKR